MNRRVLLNDSDSEFASTLAQQLRRFRVGVDVEDDPDAALAAASSNPPAALVIAVEEPAKQGFKTFQKARKSLSNDVAIVLVTSTLSSESFSKHRAMKVHADEYVDKREITPGELIALFGRVIDLGDPQDIDEDDLPIEDIPMEIADGDVLLDEESVDDDPHGGFDQNLATVNPNSGVLVDRMVAAETDAAFDALLGDDMFGGGDAASQGAGGDESPEAVDEEVSEAMTVDEQSAVPEPVPHKIPDDVSPADGTPADNSDFDMDSVPSLIQDGGLPSERVVADAGDDLAADGATVIGRVEGVSNGEDDSPIARESLTAIPIVDDDLVDLDEEMPVEAPAAASAVAEQPVRKTGAQPAVDLGLDSIAENAEREQSGVYDRKQLFKIGELERQVTQLKAELERARAEAETAAKGGGSREAQFLGLREQNLAKDKELKQVKATLEQQAKELAESQEKLRQAQHAKTTLETKNSELEERILNEGGKEKELAASLKEVTAKASQLEHDLGVKAKAAEKAETALAQLERDLAKERATRAASASDAERSLRLEKEQLIQRHKGEMAALRAETEAAQEFALSRLREELEIAHQTSIEEALEAQRKKLAAEQADALAAAQKKHDDETVSFKIEQAGELSRLKNEHSTKVQELEAAIAEAKAAQAAALAAAEQQHTQALEQQRERYEAEIEAREEEWGDARTQDAEAAEKELAGVRKQLDEANQAHEAKVAELKGEQERARAAHEANAEEQRKQHEAAVATLRGQHETTVAEMRAKHEQWLAELDQAAKDQKQAYEAKLADAHKAAEDAAARHRSEREELEQAHARKISELEANHERTLADAKAAHESATATAAAEHANQVEELRADAARKIERLEQDRDKVVAELTGEREDLKKGLSGARDTIKRLEGELAAATQTIDDRNADLRAHAAAIAERDQRIAELRQEIESLEQENTSYQEQVLRAYQKIKSDEAMVARARKAMAIALTVLDDQGNPPTTS